jgi:hypothetical protein
VRSKSLTTGGFLVLATRTTDRRNRNTENKVEHDFPFALIPFAASKGLSCLLRLRPSERLGPHAPARYVIPVEISG